jgi:hypothetical protein
MAPPPAGPSCTSSWESGTRHRATHTLSVCRRACDTMPPATPFPTPFPTGFWETGDVAQLVPLVMRAKRRRQPLAAELPASCPSARRRACDRPPPSLPCPGTRHEVVRRVPPPHDIVPLCALSCVRIPCLVPGHDTMSCDAYPLRTMSCPLQASPCPLCVSSCMRHDAADHALPCLVPGQRRNMMKYIL